MAVTVDDFTRYAAQGSSSCPTKEACPGDRGTAPSRRGAPQAVADRLLRRCRLLRARKHQRVQTAHESGRIFELRSLREQGLVEKKAGPITDTGVRFALQPLDECVMRINL